MVGHTFVTKLIAMNFSKIAHSGHTACDVQLTCLSLLGCCKSRLPGTKDNEWRRESKTINEALPQHLPD